MRTPGPGGARSPLFLQRVNLPHPLCIAGPGFSSAASSLLDVKIQLPHTHTHTPPPWRLRRDLQSHLQSQRCKQSEEGALISLSEREKHLCRSTRISGKANGIKLRCVVRFSTVKRTRTRPERRMESSSFSWLVPSCRTASDTAAGESADEAPSQSMRFVGEPGFGAPAPNVSLTT